MCTVHNDFNFKLSKIKQVHILIFIAKNEFELKSHFWLTHIQLHCHLLWLAKNCFTSYFASGLTVQIYCSKKYLINFQFSTVHKNGNRGPLAPKEACSVFCLRIYAYDLTLLKTPILFNYV